MLPVRDLEEHDSKAVQQTFFLINPHPRFYRKIKRFDLFFSQHLNNKLDLKFLSRLE